MKSSRPDLKKKLQRIPMVRHLVSQILGSRSTCELYSTTPNRYEGVGERDECAPGQWNWQAEFEFGTHFTYSIDEM